MAMSMQAAESRSIPQELADQIIDHLHDDLKSLRSCTLVCTLWLPSSSLHLFHCIRWPPCPHLWFTEPNSTATCSCPRRGSSSWVQQLMSIFSTSRRIGFYVRDFHLSLLWSWQHHPLHLQSIVRESGRLEWQELLMIVDAMPSLNGLTIRGLRFCAAMPGDQPSRTIPRSLHGLTLDSSMRHLDLASFGCFLRSFNHIKNFIVDDFRSPGPLTHHIHGPLPSVNSVSVVHAVGFASLYFQTIRLNFDCTSIRSLFLVDVPIGDQELSALEDVLRACTNLATVICDVTPYDAFLQIPSPCPQLREFRTFGYCLFNESGISITSWDRIWAVLASPMMSNIDSLSIKFSMGKAPNDAPDAGPDNAEREVELALRSLDWTLVNNSASRLRHFDFHIELDIADRYWTSDYKSPFLMQMRTIFDSQITDPVRAIVKLHVSLA